MTQKQWTVTLAVVGVLAVVFGFVVQSQQNGSAAVASLTGYGSGRTVLPVLLWAAGGLALLGALVLVIARAPKD